VIEIMIQIETYIREKRRLMEEFLSRDSTFHIVSVLSLMAVLFYIQDYLYIM